MTVVPTVPRKRLQISYNIPFSPLEGRQNANFVGRECLLEQLQATINAGVGGAKIIGVVLHGTGGMGKTQLALQYVDLHHQDYSSVFWVNAASEQTLKLGYVYIMQRLIDHHAQLSDNYEPDYMEIGRLLGMAGKVNAAGRCSVQQQEDEQNIVTAVKQWFNNEANTRWLLVFDNLDDLDSFDLNDYIPSGRHGTVIITSRRRESLQGRQGLEVSQMNDGEAERLLIQSAKFRFEDLNPSGK